MPADTRLETRWWGEYALPAGGAAFWQVGPLRLWASRSDHEWNLASEPAGDPLDSTLIREIPTQRVWPEGLSATRRFGFRKTKQALLVMPALADRPVIVNPAVPFSLLPGEEMTLYISTVLWVRVQVGDPPVTLLEIPTHRPSDTWFGPSTMEGELCYATKTSARHQLENLPVRPHRVTSALRVRNMAGGALSVERLKLPLPNMSIFESSEGQLWTEAVTLEREQDGEHAKLELSKKPPSHIAKAKLLAGPREEPSRGSLIRAFGGVFGGIW
jgi:hypothetical protein